MEATGSLSWGILTHFVFIIHLYIVYCSESTVNKADRSLKKIITDFGIQEKARVFLKVHHGPYPAKINAVEKSEAHFILKLKRKIKSDDTIRSQQVEQSQYDIVVNNISAPDTYEHEGTDVVFNLANSARRPSRQVEDSQPCRRLPLNINFRDIQMVWVHSPEEYNAYYCEGECSYPLVGQTSTNHAIFQSRHHFYKPTKSTDPCCVPTKLSDLDIVYYVGRTAKTETYKDMVVEECGCR